MIKIWLNYEISGSKMSLIEEFRHETNFDHYISKFVFFPVDLVFFFLFSFNDRTPASYYSFIKNEFQSLRKAYYSS